MENARDPNVPIMNLFVSYWLAVCPCNVFFCERQFLPCDSYGFSMGMFLFLLHQYITPLVIQGILWWLSNLSM